MTELIQIFKPGALGTESVDWAAQMGSDPNFHAAAAEVAGYDEVVARWMFARSLQYEDPEPPRPTDLLQLAHETLAGADPMVLARQVQERTEYANLIQYSTKIRDHVTDICDQQARAWLAGSQDALAEQFGLRLVEVVEQASAVVKKSLAGVRRVEDLEREPSAADAWVQWNQHAAKFASLTVTVERLATNGAFGPIRWPLAWLWRNYQSAWDEFYLLNGLPIVDTTGIQIGRIPPQIPWWEGLSRSDLLRQIVDRKLQVFAYSPAQLAARMGHLELEAQNSAVRRQDAEVRAHYDGGSLQRLPVFVNGIPVS